MEILKEILRIVTSKADVSKVLPELDEAHPSENGDSLTGRYLRGLINDTYSTDEEAAQDLYQKGQSDQRYRTLKSRTYERLLHSILFLQVKQPEHSEYLSYYYKCTRNLLCAQSLMRFASRKAGYAVAQKTLVICQKYEFTDLCLTLCVLLRETSAFWNQRKKFDYYDNLVGTYFRVLEAEYRAEALLDRYSLEAQINSRTKRYMIDLAETIQTDISDLVQKHGSHLLKLDKVRMDITVAIQNDQAEQIIGICDRAIDYLTKNSHLSQPARLGEFRLRKMMSQIKVRRYTDAFHSADLVVKSFTEGGYNWYIALTYSACAALLSENYVEADRYMLVAVSHRKFSLLDEQRKEFWLVIGAYIHIAEELGLYQPPVEFQKKTFRLSTYLNSVPEESKSKKIVNVLILVSHVIFLIIESNFDAAEKRLEYLRVYASRYLKENHFNRVRVFLRLLQSLPRYSFNSKLIRKANLDLFDQLVLTQEDQMSTETNEYIQFEILYLSLLDFLEKHEAAVAQ